MLKIVWLQPKLPVLRYITLIFWSMNFVQTVHLLWHIISSKKISKIFNRPHVRSDSSSFALEHHINDLLVNTINQQSQFEDWESKKHFSFEWKVTAQFTNLLAINHFRDQCSNVKDPNLKSFYCNANNTNVTFYSWNKRFERIKKDQPLKTKKSTMTCYPKKWAIQIQLVH